MPLLLDIATAVPPHIVQGPDVLKFYAKAMNLNDSDPFMHQLKFMNKKTLIEKRHSCMPDFSGGQGEFFTSGNFTAPVEERMKMHSEHAIPLASEAIIKVFEQTDITPPEVTHFITVSCTGVTAPGIEFLLAEELG